MGASMFSRDYDGFAEEYAGGGSNREAVDGFSAIAAALDQGIDTTRVNSGWLADAVAISLGWMVLASVIFYPALQLAAIAICVAFMCSRSFARYVFVSAALPARLAPR
jgi:hypothetical protein